MRFKEPRWVIFFGGLAIAYLACGLIVLLDYFLNGLGVDLIPYSMAILLIDVSATISGMIWIYVRPNIYTYTEAKQIGERTNKYLKEGEKRETMGDP